MTAGSGDWDSMTDERRARYLRDQAEWAGKSRRRKVLTYVGLTLLMLVVAFVGNLVLNGLCLNVGTHPCG